MEKDRFDNSPNMKAQQHSGKKVRNSHLLDMDQLSILPNHIIYHILSLLDTKYAVQTSALSKKWKHHWTHIHSLHFDCSTFSKRTVFRKFVLHVLFHRESLHLYRLKFYCRGGFGRTNMSVVNRIFSYAKSHHVDELETDIDTSHLSLYECQTLTTLKLGDCSIFVNNLPSSFGFASLTTLYLSEVGLYGKHNMYDVFSSCLNLENLFLIKCWVACNTDILNVPAPRLVNFTILHSNFKYDGRSRKLVISAPRLKFFDFNGIYPLLLAMDKCSLDKVDIQMSPPIMCKKDKGKVKYLFNLISMVQGLSYPKSLTISLKGKFRFHYNTLDAETKVFKCKEEVQDDITDWEDDFEKWFSCYLSIILEEKRKMQGCD